jgi:alkylhydroperoxidase family enzyme
VCRGARDGGGPDAGIDEHFYDHVLKWESWPGYCERERTAAEFAYRFATDHTALREDEDFWQRCHEHFSDELLTDLALSCALWLGTGRVLRVLDIGQSCRLTL